MSIRSLCYLGIQAREVDVWKELGPEVFGFGAVESPEGVYLRTDTRHHRVAFSRGEQPALKYVGWEVGDAAELEEMESRIKSAGYDVETLSEELRAERRLERVIAVTDPEGLRHEIGCGPTETSPFQANNRGGLIGEEDGLGHFVVILPQLTQAMRDFLLEVLGFTVYYDGDYKGMPWLFVRCNDRTHCMAIGVIPGLKGLDHFFVEANDILDVGIAHDKALDRGLEMAMTLGSHRLDPGVSFYLRTPSGFNVELGCDMIRVDGSERAVMEEIWGHRFTNIEPAPAVVPIGAPIG